MNTHDGFLYSYSYFRQPEEEEEQPPREAELYEFDNCSKGLGTVLLLISPPLADCFKAIRPDNIQV